MKLLATTTALGLLIALGAVAPANAEGDTPVEATAAPVWMASVTSLALDDGLALVQDAEDDDCEDDEDEDDDDDADDEEDDEEDDDDADDDDDDDDDECEDDEDELV